MNATASMGRSGRGQPGLLLNGRGGAVPLQGVRITGRLAGPAAEVTVTQRFRNVERVDVEAVYVFPVSEGSAICDFSVRTGDRLLRGKVEERDEAFACYDDAMADGHGAFLLDQERPNVFTASVGNLRPGQEVEISLTTATLLGWEVEGDAIRLTIPTTVAPRYVPAGPPEVGQPDGERVNPERWATVPYGLSLSIAIEGARLRAVASPSHPIRTELGADGAVVSLAQEDVALDRDFVLLVHPADARRPEAHVAAEPDGTRVALVSFLPDLEGVAPGPREILFLLDCSGSMKGSAIDQVRRAVALCLRALGPGDTFNVHRFGSTWDSLWPAPRPYDQVTLDEASAWLAHMDADLGGTEIRGPLEALLARPIDPSRPRQMLLMTDGQVSNEAEIIALCEASASRARVFTFGIGAGASDYLVRGVARATRAAAETIAPGERIEPKVLRTFGRLRTPALTDIAIDWGVPGVEQAPEVCPPAFAGDAVTMLGRFRPDAGASRLVVTLSVGGRRQEVATSLERAQRGGAIPALWARERIRDLERGAVVRSGSRQRRGQDPAGDGIVALAKRYGLMSSRTSYVAVEQRAEGERSEGPAELRRIPVALTHGWGGLGGAGSAIVRGGRGALPCPAPSAAPAPAPATRKRSLGAASPRTAYGAVPAATSAPRGGLLAAFGRAAAPEPMPQVSDHVVAYSPAPLDGEAHGAMAAGDASGDALYDLLMTQQADGRFVWSPILERWIGHDLEGALAWKARLGDDLAATALAVALIQRAAAAREDEWGGAVAKAQAWLDRQPHPVSVPEEFLRPGQSG